MIYRARKQLINWISYTQTTHYKKVLLLCFVCAWYVHFPSISLSDLYEISGWCEHSSSS